MKSGRTTALSGQFNISGLGSEQAGGCRSAANGARNPGLSQQQQNKVSAAERMGERSGKGGQRHIRMGRRSF